MTITSAGGAEKSLLKATRLCRWATTTTRKDITVLALRGCCIERESRRKDFHRALLARWLAASPILGFDRRGSKEEERNMLSQPPWLQNVDRKRHDENFCALCGKKLHNGDKAHSVNVELTDHICLDCAYQLAAETLKQKEGQV